MRRGRPGPLAEQYWMTDWMFYPAVGYKKYAFYMGSVNLDAWDIIGGTPLITVVQFPVIPTVNWQYRYVDPVLLFTVTLQFLSTFVYPLDFCALYVRLHLATGEESTAVFSPPAPWRFPGFRGFTSVTGAHGPFNGLVPDLVIRPATWSEV